MKLGFTLPSRVERDKKVPHPVDERRREKCGRKGVGRKGNENKNGRGKEE
jgi:hypothetical protein